MRVRVHAADIQDRPAVPMILKDIRELYPNIKVIWVDTGYNGTAVRWAAEHLQIQLLVVERPGQYAWQRAQGSDSPPPPKPKGFQLLKRRWVVERTLAWISRNRQLSKEYDVYPEHTEAWCYLAMIRLMLRRLTKSSSHGYDPEMKKPKVAAV